MAPLARFAPSPRSTPLALAWATVGIGATAVIALLFRHGTGPETADRLLLLATGGWLLARARQRWPALPVAPTQWGWGPVLLAAVLGPTGWLLATQVGARKVVLWWLAAAVLAAAAGLILLTHGRRRLAAVGFPLGFLLLALPPPERLQEPVQRYLQELTTRLAAAALPCLGLPVARSGFVLTLPGGDLEVVEACSGIRSLTALAAVAVLAAHLNRLRPGRWLALLGLTGVIVIVVNTARILATAVLQEAVGPWATAGAYHEALGVAAVLTSLALVALGASRGRPTSEAAPGALRLPPGASAPGEPGWGLLLLPGALLLCLAVETRRPPAVSAALNEIPLRLAGWQGRDQAVTAAVAAQLACDRLLHRTYADAVGREVEIWVLFWGGFDTLAGLHHPDTCWPNHGWQVTHRGRRLVPTAGGAPLPASVRHLKRGAGEQVLLYWTQDGAEVLPEARERADLGWVGEVLTGRRPRPTAAARLGVLVGAPAWRGADATEAELAGFVEVLAGELLRVCPWAAPR